RYSTGERRESRTNDVAARNAGLADSECAGGWRTAWTGSVAAHSADYERDVCGQGGFAVFGVGPPGGRGLGFGGWGPVREQQAGEVVPADEGGGEAARGGDKTLGPNRVGDWASFAGDLARSCGCHLLRKSEV